MMPTHKIPGIESVISSVGLGTWVMGGLHWGGSDDKTAEEAIEASLAAGINLIDTAPVYGFGRAEEIVGKTVKRLKCRDQVVLATKFGLDWDEAHQNIRRNSRKKRIMKELDQSRRRLGTDVIDLYQVHWPDESTPWGETMDCLLSFYEAGLIRAIGVSNFSAGQMQECMRYAPIHSAQPPYNLFEQESGTGVIPFCRENGIAVLAYGSLCRGLLTGKFKPGVSFKDSDIRSQDPKFRPGMLEKYLKAVDDLRAMAAQKKCTVSQLALAWVFHQEGVTAALAGARSREQARENSEAVRMHLSAGEMRQMEAIVKHYVPKPISAGFMAPKRSNKD